MAEAFEFFGAVPREVWWDNPKTVAVAILRGRERTLNERYLALASHYNFEPLFCLAARGNEKPHVENRVKNLQRRWATPFPQAADLPALNAYLRGCCEADRERIASGQRETIGARFAQDQRAALALPARRFDACLRHERKVDKYQTVAFDGNRYSVPRRLGVHVRHGEGLCRSDRGYRRGPSDRGPRAVLCRGRADPRSPALSGHIEPQTSVPGARAPCSVTGSCHRSSSGLRSELEARHGALAGSRQFVRVLQLLGSHAVEQIATVIELTLARDGLQVDLILSRMERQRGVRCEELSADAALLDVPVVHVPTSRP